MKLFCETTAETMLRKRVRDENKMLCRLVANINENRAIIAGLTHLYKNYIDFPSRKLETGGLTIERTRVDLPGTFQRGGLE